VHADARTGSGFMDPHRGQCHPGWIGTVIVAARRLDAQRSGVRGSQQSRRPRACDCTWAPYMYISWDRKRRAVSIQTPTAQGGDSPLADPRRTSAASTPVSGVPYL
jgi:hypothetical protein